MKNKYAAGLEIMAWIWLILVGLVSLSGAIVTCAKSADSYIGGAVIGIGFAFLFGGALVSLTGFYLFTCIASMTENLSTLASEQKASDSGIKSTPAKPWSPREIQPWMKPQQSSGDDGKWFCPLCGKEHAGYEDTCSCGKTKPIV